ncbi:MAG: hypothetical protein HDT47_01625 [Ruminococcaceae bacterium]|nr:hypothetical protein [Oscillospiraceae bacterium]
MKKFMISFLTLSILVLFTSCSASEDTLEFSDLNFVQWGEGNYLQFFDLESLESYSEIAVVGTFIEDSTQEIKYKYMDVFDKEVVFSVKSFNEIEITKVLKGNVDVGDTLKICQEYAVVDDKFVTESALTPMMNGDTWIFFLEPSDNGEYYFCVGYSEGRYPVKDSVYKRIALTENENLGVFDEKDFKEEIYNEILEKYDL